MTQARRTLTFTDDFEGAEPPGIHVTTFVQGQTASLGLDLAVVALELGRARCATPDEAADADLPYTGANLDDGADEADTSPDDDESTVERVLLVAPGPRTNRDGLLDFLEEHGDPEARGAFVELMQGGHTVTKAELTELIEAVVKRANAEPVPSTGSDDLDAIRAGIDAMTEQELLSHLATRGVALDADDSFDELKASAYFDAGIQTVID